MKIKVAMLQKHLHESKITKEQFAQKLGVHIFEVEKLLRGEAVGINTARQFINELGAEVAQGLIDWEAIGKQNPYEDMLNEDMHGKAA